MKGRICNGIRIILFLFVIEVGYFVTIQNLVLAQSDVAKEYLQKADVQTQLKVNSETRKEIRQHQDGVFLRWPSYESLGEGLRGKIRRRYNDIRTCSTEELLFQSNELNKKFWDAGDLESSFSYQYNYEARALMEIALEARPLNEEIINQLAEIIMSAEPLYLANYKPRKKTQEILLSLRKKQFDEIIVKKENKNIEWKDFIAAYDLLRDLPDNREHKIEVANWMINIAKLKGWTIYLPYLEKHLDVLKRGTKIGMGMNMVVVKGPLDLEWKFARRPSSFQGPITRAKNIVPLHELSPSELYGTEGTYIFDKTGEHMEMHLKK